jgi:hypothetical protein
MHTTQAAARGAATAAGGHDLPDSEADPHLRRVGALDDAVDQVDDEPDGGLATTPAAADEEEAADADTVDNEGDMLAAFKDAFKDEVPDIGGAARAEYMSIRGFTPLRHVLVQHIPGAPERASTLGKLVAARQPRALLLYLLILACEHRLSHNRRLPVLTIARMLSTAKYPCTSARARRAIQVLEDHKLVKTRWKGTSVEIVPLLENGSGKEVWYQPTGDDQDPDLQRYFTLPNEFFDDAVLDRLKLPGIAVLLVALKETSKESTFSISVERFADWYGISERTAERGYRELLEAELIYAHRQLKKDSRMARGLKAVYHRTLLGAFSTKARRDAQARAKAAIAAAAKRATAQAEAGAQ